MHAQSGTGSSIARQLVLSLVLVLVVCSLAQARKRRWSPTAPTTPTSPTQPGQPTTPTQPAPYNPPPNSGPVFDNVVKSSTAPRGYGAAIPWWEAIVDTRIAGSGTVSVDYLQLWATIGGVDQIVSNSDYGTRGLSGGMFMRIPVWYGNGGAFVPLTQYTLTNAAPGYVVVAPTDPTVVYHVWATDGQHVDVSQASRVWVVARVKISGSAAFDLGWDYWSPDGSSASEGGSTRWYEAADCPDWTVITLGK